MLIALNQAGNTAMAIVWGLSLVSLMILTFIGTILWFEFNKKP